MRCLVPKISGTKTTLNLTRLHSLFPVCDMVCESGDRYGRYVRVVADEISGTGLRACVCAFVCLASISIPKIMFPVSNPFSGLIRTNKVPLPLANQIILNDM